ncbi:MAG: ligand-binding protein SH3 [Candidatus Kerfeldbacteria bacterium CG08_land_8_20_14_0_20_40_16]|uniref:Ligand-binding protein SH3 n=1 Tax=Candidatus Kerfeldbacteria bacterium CG08_land_8_20_14_0_20_40_16 TaxID=2014244 RepID=A0A2H0YWH4_9BACT|nr:MAG: ligand-binding protein SH3 [Candidatus Kerfeldbacteria bacterium CG08_land_8_20_14_0_20_40_16]
MNIDYVEIFKSFPPQLATFLIATLPIAELRASIPLALGVYNLPVVSSYIYSVLGNIFPLVFILLFLDPVSNWLSRHFKFFEKFFSWLFARTRRKFSSKYEKWGLVTLAIFVAIPLPVTGGWTGCVAAYLFGIPFKKSFPSITLGVLVAGVIVTLASLGIFSFF